MSGVQLHQSCSNLQKNIIQFQRMINVKDAEYQTQSEFTCSPSVAMVLMLEAERHTQF
jgi:hypothetical protein